MSATGLPSSARAREIAGRHGHDVLIMLLALLLAALAMIAGGGWLAEQLIVFAGVALFMWVVVYLGRRERTRAQPGQIQPRQVRLEEPASVVAATLPLADYGQNGELTDERPARRAAKDSLLPSRYPGSGAQATVMSNRIELAGVRASGQSG